MQAKSVAKQLQLLGISVVNFVEGNELEDGVVNISSTVHVQVPTYDQGLCVVNALPDDTFQFYPVRNSLAMILSDIHDASGSDMAVAG